MTMHQAMPSSCALRRGNLAPIVSAALRWLPLLANRALARLLCSTSRSRLRRPQSLVAPRWADLFGFPMVFCMAMRKAPVSIHQ
jgi:hypothetical protein